jgi:hypothetical protein
MQVKIDQEAYDTASKYDLLPVGVYTIVLFSVEEGQGAKGMYLNWECNVLEPTQFSGNKLWMITSFAEKALWRLKKLCEAVGVIPENGALNATAMLGKYLQCSVFHEEYEGKTRPKIDDVWAVDGDFVPAGKPLVYNLPDEEETLPQTITDGPPEDIEVIEPSEILDAKEIDAQTEHEAMMAEDSVPF